MKISEILTEEELKHVKENYGIISEERIDYNLSHHVLEMELSEYLMYRQLDALTMIAANLIPEEYT